MSGELSYRVASRFLQSSYFAVGDVVLYGKYKNKRGRIVGWGKDKWGNPTVEIEPIPKGRKQNKVFGLFRIWRADVKEKALAEMSKLASVKPVYTAIILDDESRDRLLRWWKSEVGLLLPQHVAHHMTIKFKPSSSDVESLSLGEPARMVVQGYAQDERVQTVVVRPSVRSTKAIPHITVALGASGQAKHSDELLRSGYEPVKGPVLTGTVQAILPDGSYWTRM